MTGLAELLRVRLRRDRWQALIWVLGTALLCVFSVTAVTQSYGSETDRADLIRLAAADPALLVLRGTPEGTAIGAVLFFQLGAFLSVLAGLMSTFLVIRHTRAEEESGRAELVGATAVSRHTPLAATLLAGVIVNVALGAAVAIGFVAGGLDPGGSALTGLVTAGVGVVFLAAAAVCAQLVRTSRAANGMAAALVGVAYLVRGIGDATGTLDAGTLVMTPGWVSWLSPIGWAQAVSPFTSPTYLPLLPTLGATIALIALAVVLESRRDLGAGLLPERVGPARARRWLAGPFALSMRLQRGSIVGWAVGAAVVGLLIGGLTTSTLSTLAANPALVTAISSISPESSGALLDRLIAALMSLVGFTAAGCVTQMLMRARHDETDGFAETVLATAVSRTRWFLSYLAAALVGAAIVVAAAGAGAALSLFGAGQDASVAASAVAAAVVQLPAAMVYLGITAIVVAIVPRATVVVGWLALAVGLFLGQFGGLIGAPEWLRRLSPFVHTPGLPGPDIDWSGGVWMVVIAVALAVVATLVLRRRDLAV